MKLDRLTFEFIDPTPNDVERFLEAALRIIDEYDLPCVVAGGHDEEPQTIGVDPTPITPGS